MYKAIAANKRNTILVMAVFVVIIAVIGWIVSYFYGNIDIAYWVIGVAAAYAILQYFIANSVMLAMSGAQEIEKADNPRLYRIVENLAITVGTPTPKVYIIDDPAPNAFSTGRDPKHASVAATTGILSIMDDRELEAVMAHEMGHVQNYDIRVGMIAFGLVSAIGLLTDIVIRMVFFGGDRRNNNVGANPVILVAGIIALVLAPVLATIIQLAVSRQREYLADATGALTTRDPEALASALEKLEQYGPLKPGIFNRLFSTHPPLADRIARLRASEKKF
jgi:heat shock protein HtpX